MPIQTIKYRYISLLGLFSLCSLHANIDDKLTSMQQEIKDLQAQVDTLKKEKGIAPICTRSKYHDYDGYGVSLMAEALYWRGHENGLGVAATSKSADTIAHGNIINLHFEWDAGARIGIGYELPYDRWDLYLTALRFHNDAHRHVSDEKEPFLFPIWTNALFVGDGTIDEAEAHWRVHLGVIDLELGRTFNPSCAFSIRPFIGIRYASIRQKYNLLYLGGTLFPEGQDVIRMKNKFWGIGPLMGANIDWFLGEGFSLFVNGAFSLLQGNFYIHQDEEATVGMEDRLKMHDHFQLVKVVTDLSAGFLWEHLLCKDRYRISLHAGWENHVFFGQNQLYRFVGSTMAGANVSNQGDLTTQGLIAGGGFDF